MLFDLRCFDDDGSVNVAPTGRTTSAVAVDDRGTVYGYVAIDRDASGRLAYRATMTDPATGKPASAVNADAVSAVVAVAEGLSELTSAARAVASSIAFPFLH